MQSYENTFQMGTSRASVPRNLDHTMPQRGGCARRARARLAARVLGQKQRCRRKLGVQRAGANTALNIFLRTDCGSDYIALSACFALVLPYASIANKIIF